LTKYTLPGRILRCPDRGCCPDYCQNASREVLVEFHRPEPTTHVDQKTPSDPCPEDLWHQTLQVIGDLFRQRFLA
jgi:hypothetical protein